MKGEFTLEKERKDFLLEIRIQYLIFLEDKRPGFLSLF
jgi:hypothetical protein